MASVAAGELMAVLNLNAARLYVAAGLRGVGLLVGIHLV